MPNLTLTVFNGYVGAVPKKLIPQFTLYIESGSIPNPVGGTMPGHRWKLVRSSDLSVAASGFLTHSEMKNDDLTTFARHNINLGAGPQELFQIHSGNLTFQCRVESASAASLQYQRSRRLAGSLQQLRQFA